MIKHNLSYHKLYAILDGIYQRCNNKNNPNYKYYGKRGIKNHFGMDIERFHKWATTNGWKEGLTIDRIDNNGDYIESNCRWITKKEQAFNRRNNQFFTAWNET